MSNTISLEINKRTLTIDIGKIAKQADGSALLRYGDTMMLVTATSRKELKEGKDFLPLIVDYRENTYAAGKIPGGFFKREGRPSEREILIARLIDRPIRPLFPAGYFFDTQIVGLLLSADLENEPDTLGVIGASAALYFSDIPYTTPLGAVKVGLVDGRYVVNPTDGELDRSPINMTVVSNEDGIIMIEAGAKEVEEDVVLEGLALAHETNQQIIRAQKDLYARLGLKKREFAGKVLDQEKLARGEHIQYVKDTPNAMDDSIAQIDAGRKQAAFFMNPVKIQQLKLVTDAGERMPQKSTYFYPKVYSGLTINKF